MWPVKRASKPGFDPDHESLELVIVRSQHYVPV